jgi:hypothetical protein
MGRVMKRQVYRWGQHQQSGNRCTRVGVNCRGIPLFGRGKAEENLKLPGFECRSCSGQRTG